MTQNLNFEKQRVVDNVLPDDDREDFDFIVGNLERERGAWNSRGGWAFIAQDSTKSYFAAEATLEEKEALAAGARSGEPTLGHGLVYPPASLQQQQLRESSSSARARSRSHSMFPDVEVDQSDGELSQNTASPHIFPLTNETFYNGTAGGGEDSFARSSPPKLRRHTLWLVIRGSITVKDWYNDLINANPADAIPILRFLESKLEKPVHAPRPGTTATNAEAVDKGEQETTSTPTGGAAAGRSRSKWHSESTENSSGGPDSATPRHTAFPELEVGGGGGGTQGLLSVTQLRQRLNHDRGGREQSGQTVEGGRIVPMILPDHPLWVSGGTLTSEAFTVDQDTPHNTRYNSEETSESYLLKASRSLEHWNPLLVEDEGAQTTRRPKMNLLPQVVHNPKALIEMKDLPRPTPSVKSAMIRNMKSGLNVQIGAKVNMVDSMYELRRIDSQARMQREDSFLVPRDVQADDRRRAARRELRRLRREMKSSSRREDLADEAEAFQFGPAAARGRGWITTCAGRGQLNATSAAARRGNVEEQQPTTPSRSCRLIQSEMEEEDGGLGICYRDHADDSCRNLSEMSGDGAEEHYLRARNYINSASDASANENGSEEDISVRTSTSTRTEQEQEQDEDEELLSRHTINAAEDGHFVRNVLRRYMLTHGITEFDDIVIVGHSLGGAAAMMAHAFAASRTRNGAAAGRPAAAAPPLRVAPGMFGSETALIEMPNENESSRYSSEASKNTASPNVEPSSQLVRGADAEMEIPASMRRLLNKLRQSASKLNNPREDEANTFTDDGVDVEDHVKNMNSDVSRGRVRYRRDFFGSLVELENIWQMALGKKRHADKANAVKLFQTFAFEPAPPFQLKNEKLSQQQVLDMSARVQTARNTFLWENLSKWDPLGVHDLQHEETTFAPTATTSSTAKIDPPYGITIFVFGNDPVPRLNKRSPFLGSFGSFFIPTSVAGGLRYNLLHPPVSEVNFISKNRWNALNWGVPPRKTLGFSDAHGRFAFSECVDMMNFIVGAVAGGRGPGTRAHSSYLRPHHNKPIHAHKFHTV
eukprot:g15828.t1